MSELSKNLKKIRKEKNLSQQTLAERMGTTKQVISRYERGERDPKTETLFKLADALQVSIWELIGWDYQPENGVFLSDEWEKWKKQKSIIEQFNLQDDLILLHSKSVPILGDIACGVPITAEQNIEGYANLPDSVRADFALRCKGDSMEPTFLDGDLVLIRQEGDVSDGRIAAVLLDSETDTEATLKRVHHVPGGLILIPDNQKKYGPRTFQGSEAAKIRILGVAVGYVRMI